MRYGIEPRDEIRVYDDGYEDGEADIVVTHPILSAMRIDENNPILVRVSDESPRQIEILGQASDEEPTDPYTVKAKPDPNPDRDFPPRYSCLLPRAWRDEHFRLPEEDLDDESGFVYEPIEADYPTEEAKGLVSGDGTLVIPF